jgi:hypothetical protein
VPRLFGRRASATSDAACALETARRFLDCRQRRRGARKGADARPLADSSPFMVGEFIAHVSKLPVLKLEGVAAVPLIFLIIRISRNRLIMGEYVSGRLSVGFIWLAFGTMAGAALAALYTFLRGA